MADIYHDDIDTVMTHMVCKARAFLQKTATQQPPRIIVQGRRHKALTSILIASLDASTLNDQVIAYAANQVVAGLEYPEKEKDRDAFVRILTNLSYLLEDKELVITGARKLFDYAVAGNILHSQIDMTVKDTVTGYIHPAIVDFSSTKYEPYYNPVVYKAQSIVDFLDLMGTNTQVMIFTAAEGKTWIYDHRKYGPIVRASLEEALCERQQQFNGVRFGWWCAGCPYRGICHSLLTSK